MTKAQHHKASMRWLDEEIAGTDETRELRVVVNKNAATYVMVELRHMKGVNFISSHGKGYELTWRKRKAAKKKSRRRG